MAWGRRCEIGCESWPDDKAYETCPKCDEPAKRYKNLTPLDESEAKHEAFEVFYAKRCERLGIPVDGPLPETKTRALTMLPKPRAGTSGGGARAQTA